MLVEEAPTHSPIRSRAETAEGSHLEFRADLEGLRGLAILLVVAYHAGVRPFTGGYIGVDVFFVLSGYLITSLLVKEVEATGRVNLLRFYARRARRLLPAACLVLLATTIAIRIVYAPVEQQLFMRAAFGTAAYLSNVWFAVQATDYLAADTASNPFLHTWSLAVEEQFYIVWPVLVGLALTAFRSRLSIRRLVTVMLVVVGVSLAGEIVLMDIAQPWAFFGSLTRAWEFGLGGIGVWLTRRWVPEGRPRLTAVIHWTGLALVLLSAILFTKATAFPGVAAIVPAVGTVALVAFPTRVPSNRVMKALSSPLMTWFGRHSYSWYLWHWPVLTIGEALLGSVSLMTRLAGAAFSLLLSAITLVTLERPVRSSRALTRRPRLAIAMAVVLTAVSVGTSWLGRQSAERAARTPDQEAFTRASVDIPSLYGSGCHVEFFTTDPQNCAFGNRASATSIVLFGDSHAAQWFPAIERIGVERSWKVIPFTKSACPAASVDVFEPKLGRKYDECRVWRDRVLERIITLRPLVVVMASSSPRNYRTPAGPDAGIGGIASSEWARGTRETVARVTAAGIQTIVMRDTPLPGFDVPTCLARAAWNPTLFVRSCTFNRRVAVDESGYQAEIAATTGMPNATVVDLTDSLCGPTMCQSAADGMVLYRDANHLTARFAAQLAPILSSSLLPPKALALDRRIGE